MCEFCDSMAAQLDSIVKEQRRYEGQWNNDIWQDILVTGAETVGTVLATRKSERFKARSIICWNTSNLTLKLSGNIVIPRNATEFVARVKPPKDIFELTVLINTAGGPGEVLIYLTEELLSPTVWSV
jgi:hypothetical protein